MDGDDGSSTSSSGRLATALPVVLDPMGYYEVLGLTPAIEVSTPRAAAAAAEPLGAQRVGRLQHGAPSQQGCRAVALADALHQT